MKCKLSEKCEFGNLCKDATRHDSLTVLGCSSFKTKKSMTNEEWIKSLDTEGLVDYLYEVHKGGDSVERQRWIERHKERVKMQFRGWLKQPHHEKE